MQSEQYNEYGQRTALFRGSIENPSLICGGAIPFSNFDRGFFETILYEDGILMFYKEHVQKMKETCHDFNITLNFSDITENLIYKLLESLNLINHCSKVNIVYAPIGHSRKWESIVTATPYTRPAKDFSLSIHDKIYESELNGYKSLNCDYRLFWKNHYKKINHSDEVLFCNKEGNILQGSSSNILLVKDSILYYVDKTYSYLRGITQTKLVEKAERIENLTIRSLPKGIETSMLRDADEVMISNSLMLVQNVRKIQNKTDILTWGSSPSSDYLATKLRIELLKNE